MLRLAFEFPAGRYHATPWGRHVNEGVVEWPPSPWRIVRALIATGFNKLGWSVVPAEAEALVARLSSKPPAYWLPPAAAAHTRHYMPVFKGSPDKVIDAFAYVGTGVLGVEWPVELTVEEERMLDLLLPRFTYLGRAESWVDARRIGAMPEGLEHCAHSDAAPGCGYDRIELLAALTAEDYADWRAAAFEREQQRTLDAERERATQKNKAPPKKLGKKQLARLNDLLPPTLVDALCVDTAALQKAGWSQPPGARSLAYWRRSDALAHTVSSDSGESRRQGVDTALLAISSDTANGEALPNLTDALRRAEMLHGCLVSAASKHGKGPASSLTGKDSRQERLLGHRHAHIIPVALDDPRRIDHFLIHAQMGFEPAALIALRMVRKTYAKNLPPLFLTLAGLGTRKDFERLVPQVGSAVSWVSATPFVPPRHLKRRGANSLEGQIRAELESRGLPSPMRVEVEIERGRQREYAGLDLFWSLWRQRTGMVSVAEERSDATPPARLSTRWRHFRRERSRENRRPPVAAGFGLRLVFSDSVPGPIALGYASHFGLGLFEPETEAAALAAE
ncbi:MAG: type I-U CRISPR-associated protein Cas5/Cas6 [Myxococcales bacterium]|nr:type I-U CRISPR-associated protein Cas5/Cas6 [Myxococcales bacterium]MCB9579014.1 type I-U CRISPR-associated protein Cas5/Cas6 [Polyangiaceae bacterium]